MRRKLLPYMGVTYPKIFQNRLIHWLWKKCNCPRGMHLWDEVWSPGDWSGMNPDYNHYLSCDACGRSLEITGRSHTEAA